MQNIRIHMEAFEVRETGTIKQDWNPGGMPLFVRDGNWG